MASIKYVPKNQRQGGKRRLPERFHGAFTGGFSAGHFNTVGTEEGWQPRTNIEEGQKMEDYMDEQDHNEWGGPQGVRRDFQARHLATKPEQVGTGSHLEKTLFGSRELIPSNIGSRLLRKLGWKEGSSYAFVPADRTGATKGEQSPEEDELNARVLSNRRIRKIRIQQTNMKIPSPKMDTVGLGFEAHKDAPEFAAFLAKRKRRAQERAQGNHRSVYRLSTVLGDPKTDQMNEDPSNLQSEHNYESYEVVEDFVGTRTVGGFALRDDEDDAFDDHAGQNLTKVSDKVVVDKDKYNTVIEDPVSDEDDGEESTRRTVDVQDLSAGFSAFADSFDDDQASQTRKAAAVALTSDGRPPLSGFTLGGGDNGVAKRFRGPNVPADFEEKLHVFRDDEHPLVWKTLTRAVQLENEDARKEAAMQGALASRRVHKKTTGPQQTSTPLAGSAFASLASSMKDRFTSSSVSKGESDTPSTLPAGLTSSDALPRAPALLSQPVVKRRDLSVTQTTQSFAPAPLLCRRFGVRAPSLSSAALVPKDDAIISQEQSFFVDKVLTAAKTASPSQSAPDEAARNEQTTDTFANRPPMSVYESIFGVTQEEEEPNSETEQKDLEKVPFLSSARNPLPVESATRENAGDSRSIRMKAAAASHHRSDDSFSSDGSEERRKASHRSSEYKKRRKKERKKKEKRKRRKRERRDSHDSSGSTEEGSKHGHRTNTHKDSRRSKKTQKNP